MYTKATGVTLVELMIVVSIASIMAAIATPSFADFIASTRLTSTMSQLNRTLTPKTVILFISNPI